MLTPTYTLLTFYIIFLKEEENEIQQRLLIGREIYTHEITISQVAEKHGINRYTARDYMREYRDINNLEPMSDEKEELIILKEKKISKYEDLKDMTKEQLIDEVIKARVGEERAKKGCIVKGDGQEKEFIISEDASSK